MLSKRDNALIALRGEKPEYVPCFFDACQIVSAEASLETPPRGQGSGYDGYGASLSMYNPAAYAPGGKLHTLSQAVEKYGKIY